MLIHANKEELQKLAHCFYDVSRTLISIYDVNKELICAYPPKLCRFCNEVRKSPRLTEKCFSCDRLAFEKCDKTNRPVAYTCHMGLLEVAAPIRYNHITLGYMLFGQITDKRDKSKIAAALPKIAAEHGLDLTTLEESLQKIKYRSPDYIESISKIMEMCANYIWQNSFIGLKNNTTANSLDMFIRKNLRGDLSVERLCREFHASRSTLYTLSKEHFGCGISEQVLSCRIEAAKTLLRDTDTPVAGIAEEVGIPDANYFTRCFKGRVGCSPLQYRKRHR